MVFAAILPWQLFATSLSEGINSLISNSNLISKVYFSRLIVPASAVIVSFVDFSGEPCSTTCPASSRRSNVHRMPLSHFHSTSVI